MTDPGQRKKAIPGKALLALVTCCVLLVLMAGGIIAGIIIRGRTPDVLLPQTESELRQSREEAMKCLTADGRELAEGKTEDLSIYSINARLDTEECSVAGEEAVLFTNTTGEEVSDVVFRVYPNDPSVRSASTQQVAVTEARVDEEEASASIDGSLLTVDLPSGLPRGESALIEFDFKEYVPELEEDFGSLLGGTDGYGIFGHTRDTYNLGYWIPQIVSFRDGSWDSRPVPEYGDPSDFECAFFNVAFETPKEMLVAAPGAQLEEEKFSGGRIYRFAAGPVRDFEIQASSRYEVVTSEVGSTLVSSYYLSGSERGGEEALEYASSALEQYSDHFGPYPYTRFNVCEAPLTGGAAGMEFSGQILIGQMFYGDLGPSIPGLEELEEMGEGIEDLMDSIMGGLLGDTFEFVVAHEVCHQWFALGVGSDSIGRPWQDESLVNYCAVLYFKWEHGLEEAEEQMQIQIVLPYQMTMMMGGEDSVVDMPVDDFRSSEDYVAAVYNKGSVFFHELEILIGEEAFDRSLREYYEEYVFLEATGEELVSIFERNAPDARAVASLFQRWMKEEHGEEDIGTATGTDGIDDLFDRWLEDGLDLDILDDMLKDLLDDEDLELLPDEEEEKVI